MTAPRSDARSHLRRTPVAGIPLDPPGRQQPFLLRTRIGSVDPGKRIERVFKSRRSASGRCDGMVIDISCSIFITSP